MGTLTIGRIAHRAAIVMSDGWSYSQSGRSYPDALERATAQALRHHAEDGTRHVVRADVWREMPTGEQVGPRRDRTGWAQGVRRAWARFGVPYGITPTV
jgi:hypothetical protein